MARPMKPLVKSGGYYPSNRWTPLVYPGGYTTMDGFGSGDEPIEKTVSGSVVSFSDAIAAPLQSLSVAVEPNQNLNGYDNPWPAGGGKNKLALTASGIKALNNLTWTNNAATSNGITFTILEDAAGNVTGIQANGTASATAQITISKTYISQGIYYLSEEYYSRTAFVRGVFRDANNAAISIGGSVFTDLTVGEAYREVPSNVSYVNLYINIVSGTNVNNVVFKPMLRDGTESGTYAPSSNICPISGWTGAMVTRAGINVWDEEWELGLLNSDGNVSSGIRIVSKNYIPVVPNKTYCFSLPDAFYAVGRGAYYDADKNLVQYLADFPTNISYVGDRQFALITVPANASYLKFCANGSYGSTYNHDISINYPSTDRDYHAYQGTTYTIQLGDTVYGGTLDVTTGKLTVDRAIYDFGAGIVAPVNGSEDARSQGLFSAYGFTPPVARVSDISAVTAPDGIICNQFVATPNNAFLSPGRSPAEPSFSQYATSFYVQWSALVGKTNAEAKTLLTGVQISAPLATPIVYDLTPTQIEALQGNNTVWADAGDVTVTYLADGNASDAEALGILLGGRYTPSDDVTDKEALDIILGGTK